MKGWCEDDKSTLESVKVDKELRNYEVLFGATKLQCLLELHR